MDQTSTSLTTLRDRNFLANARAQLDADHYGLDKIKRRLIEYLAVVRLKELQAEKAHQLEVEKAAHAVTEKPMQVEAEKATPVEGMTGVKEKVDGQEKDESKSLVCVRPTSVPKPLVRKTVKGPILL